MEVLWKPLWINAQRNTVSELPGVNYDSSSALLERPHFGGNILLKTGRKNKI